MEEAGWVTSYCLDEPGFPKILYSAMSLLGIMEHPEYVGREYREYGTDRCEVTVHVGRSEYHPDTRPWRVTTTGFHFADTYQAAARKALRYLCQMYERHIGRLSMRFFPPMDRNRPTWLARMRTVEGPATREEPTVVALTNYLLALDELYDEQAAGLRRCIRRAEEAETRERNLRLQLAEAKVQAAEAEARATAATEALKAAEDRHTIELKEAYLVTRAFRRTPSAAEDQLLLEGIPISSPGKTKRKFSETTPAPPPPTPADNDNAANEEEEPLLLTQRAPAEEPEE